MPVPTSHQASGVPTLAAQDVSKSFGPVTVLEGINLDVHAGEIHAIVGENGAGKSTLMKILAGVYEPTRGSVLFRGNRVRTGDLREMENLGVRFIHQELNLAEDLTVVENLFLGQEPRRGFFLDEGRMHKEGRQVLAEIGANLPLSERVGNLRVSEKQMVEIAKAIAKRASVLILDEPTAVLTQREAERLFKVMERFAAEGVAILYISHRLEEVKRLAHRITVLRDGKLVATRHADELSPNDIVRLMVGRDLHDLFPPKVVKPELPPVLEVKDLTIPGYVQGASFSVKEGEILGFAGLIGAGRTELWEGAVGLREPSSGGVWKNGKRAGFNGYPQALERLRIAYLPEDRKGKGLLVEEDARTNYSLLGLKRFGAWFVNERKEREAFRTAVDQFQIKVSKDQTLPVNRFSGGNQQKVVLAKILTVDPEIIVFDEPTRGIDVGTKAQIYRWIGTMAAEGRSCVVISSELLEIIGLCHRVLVMRSGRIVADLTGDAINEDEIMLYATGVKQAQAASRPLEGV
jgi:ribose transport system ATP-binding protein